MYVFSSHMSILSSLQPVINHWSNLQKAVNQSYDSNVGLSGNAKAAAPGVKQILEKKEGLFRKNMMVRVHWYCMSIIYVVLG